MSEDNLWCPLPWSHLSIKNNGTMRICSHSVDAEDTNVLIDNHGEPLNIKTASIDEVMNSNTLKKVRKKFLQNKWPSQCARCKNEYELGKNSRNLWEAEKHLKHTFKLRQEDAEENTASDGTVDPQILTLDLRMGNECNLRCTMCFPGESKLWYKDFKEITGEDTFDVDGETYSLDLKEADFDWSKKNNTVEKLLSVCQYLTKIKFGGGEPVIMKHNKSFIKKLIEMDLAKNIELEYSINITKIPQDMWDLWTYFRQVVLCCSLDGIGLVAEACRWPTKWEDVKKNLSIIDNSPSNIYAFTSTTISSINYEHFIETMYWIKKQNFQKINKHNSHFASHAVREPKPMSIAVFSPDDFRYIQEKLYDDALNLSNTRKEYDFYCEKINFYKGLYDIWRNEEYADEFNRFQKQFFAFERLQSQNWKEIFPITYSIAVQDNA